MSDLSTSETWAKARRFYEERPWVAIALGLRVHVREPLHTMREAAAAIADEHGGAALRLIAERTRGMPCAKDMLAAAAVRLWKSRRLRVEDVDAARAVLAKSQAA